MGNHEAEMLRMLQTGEILAPAKAYQQWMWHIERPDLFRWHRALRPLPLAVTVETAAAGRVGIVHCSTWRDSWNATIKALEKRAGPTHNEVAGIDRVIAGHDARKERSSDARTCGASTRGPDSRR